MGIKELEIIHFNDLHSNFYVKDVDGIQKGGVSFLNNYIKKEKQRKHAEEMAKAEQRKQNTLKELQDQLLSGNFEINEKEQEEQERFN